MKKYVTSLVGACGEHYVAACLSGHGFVVAMPRAGVPGCDMFVGQEKGGKAVRIQVKTGTKATKVTREEGKIYLWSTSYSALNRNTDDLWYAFVWLNDWPHIEHQPEVFFVPAKRVLSYLRSALKIKDKWPYFWMKAKEAEKFRGEAGIKLMLKSLKNE